MFRKLENYSDNSKLRILFTRSGGYFQDIDAPDAPMIAPPRSILYLAGVFKNNEKVETKFLDILANYDFEFVKKQSKNPPIYFGMSDEAILNYLSDYKPHILAITSPANYYMEETLRIIDLIRKNFPSIFIIAGGPDVTNDYQIYFDRNNSIDIIVMGEGEIILQNIVNSLMLGESYENIRGIAYKKNNEIILTEAQPYNKTLDELICDYDIIDLEKYFKINQEGFPSRLIFRYPGSHRSIDLFTSRGCNKDCTFCSIHLHMGKKFRAHSVEYVLKEMKFLIEEHGVRNFHFEDDHILLDLKRFKDILRGIISNKWNITWDTPNGVRADFVDEELVQLCSQSGCTYLMFGVESGSQEVLDKIIVKDIQLDEIRHAAKLCYDYEIDTLAFYILGMPGETKENIKETHHFAFDLFKKYNLTPVFQIWRPYKNTPIERENRQSGNISNADVPVLFSKHKIPFTLFYSKIYEDSEITMEYLSQAFNNYLKNAGKYAFINWIKIARRKPVFLAKTLLDVFLIFAKSIFTASSIRSKLKHYMVSPGILPFSELNKRGYTIKE